MSKVFDVMSREERDGKTYWNDTGMVVIAYEKDGQNRLMLKDNRTNQTYSIFERKKREEKKEDSPW
jgi:hypothetical protein